MAARSMNCAQAPLAGRSMCECGHVGELTRSRGAGLIICKSAVLSRMRTRSVCPLHTHRGLKLLSVTSPCDTARCCGSGCSCRRCTSRGSLDAMTIGAGLARRPRLSSRQTALWMVGRIAVTRSSFPTKFAQGRRYSICRPSGKFVCAWTLGGCFLKETKSFDMDKTSSACF
jgi:hypothetical protein